MSELISVSLFRNLLTVEKFNEDNLYNTPSENEILREIFKSSSKTGDGSGRPDRIYFNHEENILIIMENKGKNLKNAERDYKLYYNAVRNKCIYNIYGICFIDENIFTIYKEKSKINKLIKLETFNLLVKDKSPFNIKDMEKVIHNINNYLRNNTKISPEDRPFFISGILIFLKTNNNRLLFDNFTETEYIYDNIEISLKKYNIDFSIFKFMRNDKHNKHIWSITKIVNELYKNNLDIDLLNLFYTEFVKYHNTDSKSLGIVPTPDHSSILMNDLLDIKESDVVVDLCSGTGTLILESFKRNPKKVIACECSNKLFQLLKCNFILRDIPVENLINGNCFENEFEGATKSIINPPYGMSDPESELHFLIKQLNIIQENGLCCAIIPIPKINSNDKLKKQISKMSKIKCIIKCNPDLFKPINVKTCIILLEKNKDGHDFQNDLVNILDYSNDEIKNVINNGKQKTINFEFEFNRILNEKNLITIKENIWFPETEIKFDIKQFMIGRYELKLIEEYRKEIALKVKTYSDNFSDFTDCKTFKISDCFKLENTKPKNVKLKDITLKNSGIPVISASMKKGGVVGFIDESDNYQLNLGKCLTFSTCGTCYYQNEDFYSTSSIKILRPIVDIFTGDLILISQFINDKYIKKYNKERGFKYHFFQNDTAIIPNFEKIENRI